MKKSFLFWLVSIVSIGVILSSIAYVLIKLSHSTADTPNLVIRMKSVTLNSSIEVAGWDVYVYLSLGDENKVVLYNNNMSWNNELRLNHTDLEHIYQFEVRCELRDPSGMQKDFLIAGAKPNINGTIHYFANNFSIFISNLESEFYQIAEESLYSNGTGYIITTFGTDGGVKFLLALEHSPPIMMQRSTLIYGWAVLRYNVEIDYGLLAKYWRNE